MRYLNLIDFSGSLQGNINGEKKEPDSRKWNNLNFKEMRQNVACIEEINPLLFSDWSLILKKRDV